MSKLREMRALELVRRLKASFYKEDEKFAFFLGAGCSVSSGVPVCSTLIEKDWLPKLYEIEKADIDYDDWYKKQKAKYKSNLSPEMYGDVISRLFLYPQQRQHEIERICSGALPGFGYAVLAKLISEGKEKFNVIATTNFDNLMADAMFLFTNYHPLVISHESLADFIRPTTSKPIIVKLHHDAQLAPCNTRNEVSEIPPEMEEKFQSLMYDRGLIFIGYGGCDKGVLEMLKKLSRLALPYGVYWINKEKPSEIIMPWLEERNTFWIKQFYFDEFMLIVKNEFEINDPERKHVDKVFNNYYEKLNTLGQSIGSRDPRNEATKILDKALKNAIEGINDPYGYYLKAVSVEKDDPDLADKIFKVGLDKYEMSVIFLIYYARFLRKIRKDYRKADILYKKALGLDPENTEVIYYYTYFLHWNLKKYDKAESFYKKLLKLMPNNDEYKRAYAIFLKNIRKDYDQAEELYKKAIELNQRNAENYGLYANFLEEIRKDHSRAEKYYRISIGLNSKNSNLLANYAGYLLAKGDIEEGLILLEKAIRLIDGSVYPGLEVEVWFYAFIHWQTDERKNALIKLKKSLLEGIRSDFFMVAKNAKIAKEENHPEAEWILKLTEVIRDREDISILDDWPAWQEA